MGQFNLLNPDINEQTMAVYTLNPFPEYDSTNKANDIALVRVSILSKALLIFDLDLFESFNMFGLFVVNSSRQRLCSIMNTLISLNTIRRWITRKKQSPWGGASPT